MSGIAIQKYRSVFISDIHLGTKGCQAELLLDFIRHIECDTLYLVGDIVDGWKLRSGWHWPQAHNDVVQKLLRKVRKGSRLVYVPGNHDEFLRDFLGAYDAAIFTIEEFLPPDLPVTGDDGVALASALARTFDADVDVLLVVREELPDGHPGRAEYQRLLIERGEQWVAKAVSSLQADGVTAGSEVIVGESFAQTLIGFAEEESSDLIVVGGARDGFFGRHTIGPVTGALLHSSPIPVALAPRGYAEDPDEAFAAVTAAVPTKAGDDNPLPFAITLASAAGLAIRMLSLVSAENLAEAGSAREVRQLQVVAAEENLALAARALPDSPEIESLVADTATFIDERSKPTGATAGHQLAVGGERGPVENEDYVSAQLRMESGARCVLEASRVSVGEQNSYGFEIHGATGALAWDFRRMGELRLCLDQDYQNASFATHFVGSQ